MAAMLETFVKAFVMLWPTPVSEWCLRCPSFGSEFRGWTPKLKDQVVAWQRERGDRPPSKWP